MCRGRGIDEALAAIPSPDVIGEQNVSILMWAIGCESIDGVKALLDAGADPNLQVVGPSPVTLAASMNDPRFLELLLQSGGNPDAIVLNDPQLYNALMLAFDRGAGVWDDNDWTNYNLLLDAGADINQQLKRGHTIAGTVAGLGRYCLLLDLFDRGYTQNLDYVERMIRGGGMSDSDIYVECRTQVLERIEALKAEGYE